MFLTLRIVVKIFCVGIYLGGCSAQLSAQEASKQWKRTAMHNENEQDNVAQVPVQAPVAREVLPEVRLKNNSFLASSPSQLASTDKIRAGVTQYLQPDGRIQLIKLSSLGEIEKKHDAGRALDIDPNRLVYEVEIKYPEYVDVKAGTFTNATVTLAIDAQTEELIFRSIRGKTQSSLQHPNRLPKE